MASRVHGLALTRYPGQASRMLTQFSFTMFQTTVRRLAAKCTGNSVGARRLCAQAGGSVGLGGASDAATGHWGPRCCRRL